MTGRAGQTIASGEPAGLKTYRRLIPRELRLLVPNALKKSVKRALGIEDPEAQIRKRVLRLKSLGFAESALEDLIEVAESDDPALAPLAVWELACWYANQLSPDSARQALDLTDRFLQFELNADMKRRVAVLRAESLDVLGDTVAARKEIQSALSASVHPDLYLAQANLSADLDGRLACINQALTLAGIPEIALKRQSDIPAYDRLTSSCEYTPASGPKVSVIVPAFNAADYISTALEALTSQTWRDLEILVVDDVSTDTTPNIVTAYSNRDPRIQLVRAPNNAGAFVTRNIGLESATGVFVTTHDADDWAHPLKLETQVRHLLEHPYFVANMSQQARATNELRLFRRGAPGSYIFDNMSSFMFRRDAVQRDLGYWDSVRFAADSEFIARARRVFGEKSVASLPNALLSFQRQSATSLTGNSAFGFHGYLMGARKAYHEASRRYHSVANSLFYDFPEQQRPFAAPEPMLPKRDKMRHFRSIILSDYRLSGDEALRTLECVNNELESGAPIGLVQLSQYDIDPEQQIATAIRALENNGKVQFIVAGEDVTCERLVVAHPSALERVQRFLPNVVAENVLACGELADDTEVITTLMQDYISRERSLLGSTHFDFAAAKR